MGANAAMSTIRIRKYDLERIRRLSLPNESNWEFLKRVIDEYEAGRV